MKNLIILSVLSLFLISFTSAFSDQQLPQTCGGDSELIIGCLGDTQLNFLSALPTVGTGGFGSIGLNPESPNISSKTSVVVQKEEKAKKPLLLYVIPLILFFCFLIFVYKKRKDKIEEEKEEKEEKTKNLNSSTT